ncbi:MAG: hypothetical protein Q4D96_10160 [Propionibacteriaceae bacterium]|nr:hypothetical protein [Propionibacteriaceae bacterium]
MDFINTLTEKLISLDASGRLVVSADTHGAMVYCNAESAIGRHAVVAQNDAGAATWTAYIFGNTMGITDTVSPAQLTDQGAATTAARLAEMLAL